MSVNLEWSAPHQIVSPEGTLDLNIPGPHLASGRYPLFLIQPEPYTIVPASFRAVSDNLSQTDGSSLQPPFLSGLLASLHVKYFTTITPELASGTQPDPACDADLREMDERLTLHLNALRSYSSDPSAQQRLLWTPEGYGDQRMLVDVLLAAWMEADFSDSPVVATSFALASPFPYAIDATEIDTDIAAGGSGAVANAGNAAQSPVIRAHGPSTAFTITNTATGEIVSYDSTRPGGIAIASGHYAEIDFFRGTIFLDGSGTDLIAGLDPTVTKFFKLQPGSQTISATGASITVLSNNAIL